MRRCRSVPILSAVSILGLAGCSSSPTPPDVVETTGVWEFLEPLPTAVRSAGVATDGSRVYVVGGSTTAGRSTALQILDLAANAWSAGAELPVATDWGSAAWADGLLHFVGGVTDQSGASTQHFVYDPVDDVWSGAPPMPTAIAGSAGLTDGGGVFMFAGNSGGSPAYTSGTWAYDVASQIWSARAPVPGARINWAGTLHQGRFYLAGGQTDGIETSDDFLAYDPVQDAWTPLEPLPLAREAHAVVSASGTICVLGGRSAAPGNFNTPFDDVSCYDPISNAWEPGPTMPLARQELAAVSIGNLIVAIGGADVSSTPSRNVMAIVLE